MSQTSSNGDERAVTLLPISETTDLCNITYSRQKTIKTITGYFQFLTKMYLDTRPDRHTT
ncbi:hypothetical protein Slin14017_G054920 [Septoria linicola]|nr:hypothetical protein Slin14017_G054920 [Septoria linicola]